MGGTLQTVGSEFKLELPRLVPAQPEPGLGVHLQQHVWRSPVDRFGQVGSLDQRRWFPNQGSAGPLLEPGEHAVQRAIPRKAIEEVQGGCDTRAHTPRLALPRRLMGGYWNHENPIGEVGTDDLLVPSNSNRYGRGPVEGSSLLHGDPNSRHQP